MRALHPVVNSAVALFLLATAMQAAQAQTPAGQTANTPAPTATVETPGQEQQIAQPTLAPETQSVHIQVGRSIVLNTQSRLRRIVVSNPNVLDTVTVSTTQVVVTAKAPGSSSLVMWDEASNARILDVYADVDVSGLREGIKAAYPGQNVHIEAEQGRVLASGTVTSKAAADDILRMATIYSKEVVDSILVNAPHDKQIMVRVQFAEVDRVKLEQYGINILSTGAANTPGTITTGQFGAPSLGGTLTGSIGGSLSGSQTTLTPSNLLNIFLFRPDLNLGATIQDLQSRNILQILAEPNLMARSGQPAKFLAGGEFPFPVVQGGGAGTSATVTIQFKPFGVRLDFTGTIEGNTIKLKVAPEVSTLDFTNALTISGFQVPAISTRRAETEVDLLSGQSFGIAGLLDKRTTLQMSKIPGIADIPIIGNLFRSKSMNRSNTELLVMVTPIIVDPVSEQVTSVPQGPDMPIKNLTGKEFDRPTDKKSNSAPSTTSNNK